MFSHQKGLQASVESLNSTLVAKPSEVAELTAEVVLLNAEVRKLEGELSELCGLLQAAIVQKVDESSPSTDYSKAISDSASEAESEQEAVPTADFFQTSRQRKKAHRHQRGLERRRAAQTAETEKVATQAATQTSTQAAAQVAAPHAASTSETATIPGHTPNLAKHSEPPTQATPSKPPTPSSHPESLMPMTAASTSSVTPQLVKAAGSATGVSKLLTVYIGGVSMENSTRGIQHHVSSICTSCTNVSILSNVRSSGWKSHQ